MVNINTTNKLSKLDASMHRCGVVFIFDYRFTGSLDSEQFGKSVNEVLSNVARFQHNIDLLENYQAQWQAVSLAYASQPLFTLQYVDDLDMALLATYQNIASVESVAQYPPMSFSVFVDKHQVDHFMILHCGKHSYCDGSSATALFNQVVKHYNAALNNDLSEQKVIIDDIRALSSPGSDDIYALRQKHNKALIDIGRWQHIKNTVRLMSYKVSDNTHYATPHAQLPDLLAQSRKTVSEPLMRSFDITKLITYSNTHCPDVSPHNMICALLAKAAYALNCDNKAADSHRISFRVIIDILNIPMRKKMLGNYICYFPVSVDGRLPLQKIADAVNQRLFEARQQRQDVSMYKLLEFALGSGMANKSNDPVAYIIANIDNISLAHNPQRLQGAKYQRMHATANAAPLDIGGAQLNNRPTLCFNFTSDKRLILSFFSTITDRYTSEQLLDYVAAELASL